MDELMDNMRDAIEGWLSVADRIAAGPSGRSSHRTRLVKALSGKDLARLLERDGWSLQRIRGSHHIYGKPGSKVRISVPIHGNETLKQGLERHLMKMVGLPAENL